MNKGELLRQIKIDKGTFGDIHVMRFYSSFVTVSGGKVVRATTPSLAYCPLANFLYDEIRHSKDFDPETMRKTIKKIVGKKISEFGFFTKERELFRSDIAIPYGASEMLMYAMRKKIVDAAVIVCDGAGTVIVDVPEVVQGIGARMNGLFYTSPVGRTRKRLKEAGCEIVFPDALIDQVKGVERAAELGYKNIAVTINVLMDEDFKKLKKIERKYNVSVTSLAICTTGAAEERIREIEKYSDVVWSCASGKVRELTGRKAILQLSKKIPVFVLTQKGLDLISGYSSAEQLIKSLNPEKQYILDSTREGKRLETGNFEAYLRETTLPVRSKNEPK
ncbi:MAG: DUF2099 family protein [Candidatus Omnitrophota bacterium]|nr:DUF2099 family protein [Candidatus Omnitrophota bacterium]